MSAEGKIILTMPDGQKIEIKVEATPITPGENHPPVPLNKTVTTTQGSAITIELQATDPDGDDISKFTITMQPDNGTITQQGPGGGQVKYLPNPDFKGLDGFHFKATDSKGLISTEEGTIKILVDEADPDPQPVKLVVASIKDNDNDGNLPANAVDGIIQVNAPNPNRWSSNANPAILSATLQSDPQKVKKVTSVKIYFWKEAERVEKYALEFSVDGINYAKTDVIGNAGAVHEITLPDGGIDAKYINFIGMGNDQNTWNSILEIEFYGTDSDFVIPECPEGQHYDHVKGECVDNGPEPCQPQTCPEGQHWDQAQCKCVPDGGGGDGVGPYESTGQEMDSEIDGPKVRHYASGKPDDRTIEAEIKGIPYKDYQFIVDVTMKDVEHDDQVSLKYGGTHTGTGWFDNTVTFEQGECCLGKEEDHPDTDLCVKRGPKIGKVLHKRLKVAGVYNKEENHIELWTNFEGSGWVKQLEATDLGGFKPGANKDEATLRIDGFSEGGDKVGEGNVPDIHSAIVQEIKKGTPPPPPPPPCVEKPCPEGQHFDMQLCKCVDDDQPPPPGSSTTKDGVTVPFKIKGEWDYDYEKDERDGGARHNMNAAGTSLVMVGYFRSSGGSDDVAMKILGGRHTDSAPYDGCVYDPAVAVDSGEPRLRCECPHPDYTGNLDLDFEKQGVSIRNRWVGFMAAAKQEQAGVRIMVFQDQGSNDSAPANQWVKILEFFDDGTKVSGIEGEDRFPIRKIPGSAQNTFRIDETPGLQEKWLAIAEMDVS